jgi:hypothetical protein
MAQGRGIFKLLDLILKDHKSRARFSRRSRGGKVHDWAPSPIIAAESKWTTKAVQSNGAPKAPPIYAKAPLKIWLFLAVNDAVDKSFVVVGDV